MPLNEQKVLGILLEEVYSAPERCTGYRDMLRDTVTEIILAERQHKEKATTIQKQIDDQCNAAGRWLAEQQDHH